MGKRARERGLSDSESDESEAQFHDDYEVAAAHTPKYVELDDTSVPEKSAHHPLTCSLPPHGTLTFASLSDYDLHHRQMHSNRCHECHKNFPSEHFLGLHIVENHDPIAESRKARGEKIYECFVECCDRVCSAPQKRRMHMIDKHMFPKRYDFFIVNDGLDNRTSLLRPPPRAKKEGDGSEKTPPVEKSTAQDQPSTTKPGKVMPKEDEMEGIVESMSALRMVPRSIKFGRGSSRRGGLARE